MNIRFLAAFLLALSTGCMLHETPSPQSEASPIYTFSPQHGAQGMKVIPSPLGEPYGHAAHFFGQGAANITWKPEGSTPLHALSVQTWAVVSDPRGSRILEGRDLRVAAATDRRIELGLRFLDADGQRGDFQSVFSPPHVWTSGVPFRATMTWSREQKQIQLFINGSPVAKYATPANAVSIDLSGSTIVIGNRPEADRAWHGIIDELVIYDQDISNRMTPLHPPEIECTGLQTYSFKAPLLAPRKRDVQRWNHAALYQYAFLQTPFMTDVYAAPWHARGILNNTADTGAFRINRDWEQGRRPGFMIEGQRAGRHLTLTGLAKGDPSLIRQGLDLLMYPFQYQQPDGRIPSGDENHSTLLFLEALGETLLTLDGSPVADIYRDDVDVLKRRFVLAMRYRTEPGRLNPYMTSKNQFLRYTHRRYILGVDALTAWMLSGDDEFLEVAERALRDGIAQQTDEGVNPERGGFDVSYQSVTTKLAIHAAHILGKHHPLYHDLIRVITNGINRQLLAVDDNCRLNPQGSTRTDGQETTRSGKIKKPNYLEIEKCFALWGQYTNDPFWHDLAFCIETYRRSQTTKNPTLLDGLQKPTRP